MMRDFAEPTFESDCQCLPPWCVSLGVRRIAGRVDRFARGGRPSGRRPSRAGQAPGKASDADMPIAHHDRVYASEQFSNTVSVIDPVDNTLLGLIRLGDPTPGNFSPLYKGQLLVHGMGFSPDHHTLAIVAIGSNSVTFIDTSTNKVVASVPIGQAPQAIAYVPNAVPEGDGTQNLVPLGLAGQATHLKLKPVGDPPHADTMTTVVLYDQGVVQVLQASVTGLEPKQPYILGLSNAPDGSGPIEPLARFMTNPAGAAIVDTIGQIRQLVAPGAAQANAPSAATRRYLVIAPVVDGSPKGVAQVQSM